MLKKKFLTWIPTNGKRTWQTIIILSCITELHQHISSLCLYIYMCVCVFFSFTNHKALAVCRCVVLSAADIHWEGRKQKKNKENIVRTENIVLSLSLCFWLYCVYKKRRLCVCVWILYSPLFLFFCHHPWWLLLFALGSTYIQKQHIERIQKRCNIYRERLSKNSKQTICCSLENVCCGRRRLIKWKYFHIIYK